MSVRRGALNWLHVNTKPFKSPLKMMKNAFYFTLNKMEWNIFFLEDWHKFTTISGNTWKQNKTKLINYLIFMIKKRKSKQNWEEKFLMDKFIGSF